MNDEDMSFRGERDLTCPWCKTKNEYRIMYEEPWYMRVKCSCGKYFARFDFYKKHLTKKAPVPNLMKHDISKVYEYGSECYRFYAVAVASGNMHYADAYDFQFDADGVLVSFSTRCGRSVSTLRNPDWPKKWKLYNTSDRNIEKKSVCLKCRKVR